MSDSVKPAPTFCFCPLDDAHMLVNDGKATGWDVFLDLSDDADTAIKQEVNLELVKIVL